MMLLNWWAKMSMATRALKNTLKAATKVGHTFDGWFDNAKFEGEAVTEIAKDVAENVTLYAKFTPIVYTVTFNENGGEEVEDIVPQVEALHLAAAAVNAVCLICLDRIEDTALEGVICVDKEYYTLVAVGLDVCVEGLEFTSYTAAECGHITVGHRSCRAVVEHGSCKDV